MSFWTLERRPDCHLSPWRASSQGVYRDKVQLSFWSLERRPDCYFGPWREGLTVIWVLGEPALRGSEGQRPRCHLGPWSVRPLGLQVQGPAVILVLGVSDPWVYRSKARLSFGSLKCQRPLGLQVQGPAVNLVLGVQLPGSTGRRCNNKNV